MELNHDRQLNKNQVTYNRRGARHHNRRRASVDPLGLTCMAYFQLTFFLHEAQLEIGKNYWYANRWIPDVLNLCFYVLYIYNLFYVK